MPGVWPGWSALNGILGAERQLLESLREIFRDKKVFHRKHRFILFVCGGRLEDAWTPPSLRRQFIVWAEANLPEFTCVVAEAALKDSFANEGLSFVNLSKFESIIADIADCVLIFPESAGSYAEAGFFASSTVRNKTLVVNSIDLQAVESFLNLGPLDTINSYSFLKPTVLINNSPILDFAPIATRLRERVRWPEHRERLYYKKFGEFNFRQKLLVVFETLRLLRLADLGTLRYVIKVCFGGNPNSKELTSLLRILLAAKYIQRESEFFRVVANLNLIEIEHFEIEKLSAQIQFFYQKYSKDLYEALPRLAEQ